MRSRFVYFIFCILLVLTGFILGKSVNFSSIGIDNLSKTFSLLASIATVFGVLFAFLSLSSWKREYNNKKVDALIDDLEDYFNNLFKSLIDHYYAKTDLIKKQNHISDPEETDSSMKNERNKFQKYMEDEHKYWTAYEKLSRYHTLDLDSLINPAVINKMGTGIIQSLYKIHALDNFKEADDLQSSNFDKLIQNKKHCKQEFRALRIKYC